MKERARINHFLAALKQHLHFKTGRKQKCYEIELGKARKEGDEEDVKNIVHGIATWTPKIWDEDQQIVSFHSGKLASAEMSKNVLTAGKRKCTHSKKNVLTAGKNVLTAGKNVLTAGKNVLTAGKMYSQQEKENVLTARKRGENAMSDFISRFTSTGESKLNYHDPIKRQVVHTFEKIGKTKKGLSVSEGEKESFSKIFVHV